MVKGLDYGEFFVREQKGLELLIRAYKHSLKKVTAVMPFMHVILFRMLIFLVHFRPSFW